MIVVVVEPPKGSYSSESDRLSLELNEPRDSFEKRTHPLDPFLFRTDVWTWTEVAANNITYYIS